VLLIDSFPLTANGKVDRARLVALSQPSADSTEAYVAPRTATETELVTIWCDVLKRERVGVTDNFLSLGGHSLLAIRVLGRIAKAFRVRLALRALFDAPTIEQLATLIETERAAAAPTTPEQGLVSRSREAHRIVRAPAPGSTSGSDS
jgi:acyl carrier protein